QFVGEITGRKGDMVEVEVKNKFLVGNNLELMTPQGNVRFNLEQMENRKGELIDTAPGNGHVVYVPVPKDLDVNYGILLRNLGDSQDTRNPHTAA
ncbi:MAG: U32 family peptidase C-terminal domain-containing protein, partial [Aeromonas veronii]